MRKKAKPIRDEGMDMDETQPVWSPKYIFEKHIMRPTPSPTTRPRIVKFWPSEACAAIYRRASLRRLCCSVGGGVSLETEGGMVW